MSEEYERSLLEDMTDEEISPAAAGIERALKSRPATEPEAESPPPPEQPDYNAGLVAEIQAIHPRLTEAEIREAIGNM